MIVKVLTLLTVNSVIVYINIKARSLIKLVKQLKFVVIVAFLWLTF